MKRKFKLCIVDVVVILANIMFFTTYDYSFSLKRFGNFAITILFLGLSATVHYMAYTKIKDEEEETIEQLNSILQSEEYQFETYMTQLKNIKKNNPDFAHVINTFVAQIDAFVKKEEALMNLIELNNGKAKEFLVSRNNDVQLFLVKNLKKLVKRLIAYSAKTRKNRSESIENEKGVAEILSNNSELIDLYDKLLDEVARMGDDFDLDDPGLQSVIESLQDLRVETEDDSDEEGIQLVVTTGNQTSAK